VQLGVYLRSVCSERIKVTGQNARQSLFHVELFTLSGTEFVFSTVINILPTSWKLAKFIPVDCHFLHAETQSKATDFKWCLIAVDFMFISLFTYRRWIK
jgi:hypothetical protein